MYLFGFFCGAMTIMLLSWASRYSYKSTLLLKAQNNESEKLLGHWVRLELEEK